MYSLTDDMLRTFRENDAVRAKSKLGTRIEQKHTLPVWPRANVSHENEPT